MTTVLQRQKNRQRDGQTDGRLTIAIPLYAHSASRGKKWFWFESMWFDLDLIWILYALIWYMYIIRKKVKWFLHVRLLPLLFGWIKIAIQNGCLHTRRWSAVLSKLHHIQPLVGRRRGRCFSTSHSNDYNWRRNWVTCRTGRAEMCAVSYNGIKPPSTIFTGSQHSLLCRALY